MAKSSGTGWFASPNEIFDRQDLTLHEKIVALFLCRCVGPDGCAWPSYARIAKACGISRRAAIIAVQGLLVKGVIEAERRRDEEGDPATNVYRLVFGACGATGAPGSALPASPSAHGAPGVVQDMHQGGAPGALKGHPFKVTHIKKQPPQPPHTGGPGAADAALVPDGTDPVQEFYAHYCAVWRDVFPRGPLLTEGRRRKIRQRLKRFTLEQLKQACENLHASAWHRGENPHRKAYGDIDFLIRSDETVDRWLSATPPPSAPTRASPPPPRLDPRRRREFEELLAEDEALIDVSRHGLATGG